MLCKTKFRFTFALVNKQSHRIMEGIIMSYAQESAVRNILSSPKFEDYDHKITEGVEGFIILEVFTPKGTIKWAYSRAGYRDDYYFGQKGYDEFRRLFYGA